MDRLTLEALFCRSRGGGIRVVLRLLLDGAQDILRSNATLLACCRRRRGNWSVRGAGYAGRTNRKSEVAAKTASSTASSSNSAAAAASTTAPAAPAAATTIAANSAAIVRRQGISARP